MKVRAAPARNTGRFRQVERPRRGIDQRAHNTYVNLMSKAARVRILRAGVLCHVSRAIESFIRGMAWRCAHFAPAFLEDFDVTDP